MTLKCIAGIETPDDGRIVLDGETLYDSSKRINLSPQKRRVGYLFQNYALFPNMTARQNIEAAVRGKKSEKIRVADEKIGALYLRGLEHKYPSQLSGGQQQRVALARILANEPKMIMLDEPLSALDSYLKWKLELELSDTLAKFDGITLFVSHNRDEVYRLCQNVCVINDGRSEPVVSVPELFHDPRTLPAALLSGCKNYSAARKSGQFEIEALDWGARLSTEHAVDDDIRFIGVRAHYIAPGGHDDNVIDCEIIRVIDDVFSTVVMIKPAAAREDSDYSHIRIELPKEEWARLRDNTRLQVHIRPSDILLLR